MKMRTTHVPYARMRSYENLFDIEIVLALTDDIMNTSTKLVLQLSPTCDEGRQLQHTRLIFTLLTPQGRVYQLALL